MNIFLDQNSTSQTQDSRNLSMKVHILSLFSLTFIRINYGRIIVSNFVGQIEKVNVLSLSIFQLFPHKSLFYVAGKMPRKSRIEPRKNIPFLSENDSNPKRIKILPNTEKCQAGEGESFFRATLLSTILNL